MEEMKYMSDVKELTVEELKKVVEEKDKLVKDLTSKLDELTKKFEIRSNQLNKALSLITSLQELYINSK